MFNAHFVVFWPTFFLKTENLVVVKRHFEPAVWQCNSILPIVILLLSLPLSEEKAMYSAELERHKKEKEEWRRKAVRLEDQASAIQVNLQSITDHRIHSLPFTK